MAGGYRREEPGSWTGQDTDSAGGDGARDIERADPASSINFGDGALLEVLGWAGSVGNRSAGGGDNASADDGKDSLKYVIGHPSGGVGVGVNPRLVAAGDRKAPRLGCDGRSVPGDDSGWESNSPQLSASDVSRVVVGSGDKSP